MNNTVLALMIAASVGLSGCEKSTSITGQSQGNLPSTFVETTLLKPATQSDIDHIAQSLQVSYRVITNVPSLQCDKNIENGVCFEVELTLTANDSIHAKDWMVHFSQISPIQSYESEQFSVKHLNGDLHSIRLKDSYTGFSKGETKKIRFRAAFWSLAESDAMPNYIVSATVQRHETAELSNEAPHNAGNIQARVIDSTKAYIDKETGLEILPHVVEFTDYDKQFKRSENDATQWLTPEALYHRNHALFGTTPAVSAQVISQQIIPTPTMVTSHAENETLNFSQGFKTDFTNVNPHEVNAAISRLKSLSVPFSDADNALALHLSIVPNNNKSIGSYRLNVTKAGVNIVGVDANGVFNGLQSLASLITLQSTSIPLLEINDEPHFAFRGMLVDVARNFHSKAFILSLLDQMAAYKLNKLHLHLGDDEGWRLEIPSLPELTDIGSKRCFDTQEQECLMPQLGAGVDKSSRVNGYYSVEDYQEILSAATARHIQVIPSLDMPGHSRSSVVAMNARYKKYQAREDDNKAKQYLLDDFADTTTYSSVQFYGDNTINVCLESSYDFVIEVMTQVKKIHQAAGHPLTRYHIGADETAGAWIDSPACKAFIAKNEQGITDVKALGAYFIERVAGILSQLDIETAGWSDGMEHTRKENMPAVVQANAWDALFWGGHSKVHGLANRNWQVVLSSPDALYFDFPYEADPKEHGYYWASRHTNTEKVFQFMPDNLPAHAEFWLDREDNPYEADDTQTPLADGTKFLGIQGQLWSENTRTDDMVEHKIFPRLLALAERAWHKASWAVPYNYQGVKYNQQSQQFTPMMKAARDAQWQRFATTLGQKELAKLELANVAYRLPTVGAVIKNSTLYANVAFPGLAIEYQESDSEWQRYQGPVEVKGQVKVRARSYHGRRKGRSTLVSYN